MDCFRILESLGKSWEGWEARRSGPTSAAQGTSSRLPSACPGRWACQGGARSMGREDLVPAVRLHRTSFTVTSGSLLASGPSQAGPWGGQLVDPSSSLEALTDEGRAGGERS